MSVNVKTASMRIRDEGEMKDYEMLVGKIPPTEAEINSAVGINVKEQICNKVSKTDIDSELSDISENPVQNKVISSALSAINEEIVQKVNEPAGASVGDLFVVDSIDENGHYVLKHVQPQEVAVTDVQRNGTSLVTDGIANIPEDLIYVCTYGVTTVSELKSALNAGKIPTVYYDSKWYIYAMVSNGFYEFTSLQDTGTIYSVLLNSSGVWSISTQGFQNSKYRLTSMANVSSSTYVADYPNAAAVYNFLTDQSMSEDNQQLIQKTIGLTEAKEWILKANITSFSTESSIDWTTVDFSGCTEFLVEGFIKLLDSSSISNVMISFMPKYSGVFMIPIPSSSHIGYIRYLAQDVKGTSTCISYGQAGSKSPAYTYTCTSSHYNYIGLLTSKITAFGIESQSVRQAVESCDLKIYAR